MPPLARVWLAAVLVMFVTGVMTPAFAQMPVPDESGRQRAGAIRKEKRRQEIDRAYEATRKRMPDAQKADPWAGLRGDSDNSQKK